MLTTAVRSRCQTPPPPKEQERVFSVMAEHSFLRLGFKSDHYELSGICFGLSQTPVTLSYGIAQILQNTDQLSQVWEVQSKSESNLCYCIGLPLCTFLTGGCNKGKVIPL
jgi:hypothetical protein